jgi:hypothetical protein
VDHVAPEALDGATIGFVRYGELIEIDVNNHSINLLVDESELNERARHVRIFSPRYTSAFLDKFARLVQGPKRVRSRRVQGEADSRVLGVGPFTRTSHCGVHQATPSTTGLTRATVVDESRSQLSRVVLDPTRGYIGTVTFRNSILEVVAGARRR